MEKDNPARRLLFILEKGKSISSSTLCEETWYKILEIKNHDKSLLFNRLGKLITLPNTIKEDVLKYHPEQIGICTVAINNINKAFSSQNLSSQWSTFINYITNETLNYLTLIARLLDYEYKTQIIEEKKLSDFRDSVDILIKEIKELNVSDNFKKYLLSYLKKIVNSIDEYQITGVDPIIESFETIIGHTVINKDFGENIKDTKLTDKFIKMIKDLNELVSTGNNLLQLSNGVLNFLPK